MGIVLKETDEFIGFCITGIKEELSGPNREVAYSISKHYRNKGYTTQAVKGLVNYLFEKTDVEELNAVVLPRNVASNKVLEKSGFQLSTNKGGIFCEKYFDINNAYIFIVDCLRRKFRKRK